MTGGLYSWRTPSGRGITTKVMRWVFPLVWGLLTLPCVLTGCNSQGCTDNHSALPLMAFYSSSTKQPMVLDSLEMGGVNAPGDSMLIYPGQSLMTVYLPFRFQKEQTSFMFHYAYKAQGLDDPRINDTVTFRYTSEPFFASEDCGAFYVFHIKGVDYTRHLIDSIGIVDSIITNVDMERIQVYFRTAEPDTPHTPVEQGAGARGVPGAERRAL